MKIKICAIGECMMELSNAKHALYSQSIAGDTLNFSSYLDKNIFDTSYFTAVGTSEISKRVIRFLQKQKNRVRHLVQCKLSTNMHCDYEITDITDITGTSSQ